MSQRLILFSLLVLFLAGITFSVVFHQAKKVNVDWQLHAETGDHAADTASVRYCLENKGPYQVWKDRNEKNKFYLLCQVDAGRWGFASIIKEGEKWVEKTSFIPRNGSWKEIISYLEERATRFMGEVPGLLG